MGLRTAPQLSALTIKLLFAKGVKPTPLIEASLGLVFLMVTVNGSDCRPMSVFGKVKIGRAHV